MIGICTDSNSHLPATLVERYQIEVVPATVTVDELDYLEGVDLDSDQFYAMLAARPRPVVSTSHPSPGQFAVAYESLLHRGCDQILSVHVTAAISDTLNSARLATRSVQVPVRLVDSGTIGFGVSCCVWAAADAVADGADLETAARVAETLLPRTRALLVLGQPDFIRTGEHSQSGGVPIMAMRGTDMEVLDRVDTIEDAVEKMAEATIAFGARLKTAVGFGDRTGEALTGALADSLSAAPNVLETVRYRIGPSIGAYIGAGTVACYAFEVD
ncbi:MAG TPA: DegV family protein [Ilumatobacteraceae bacterium]